MVMAPNGKGCQAVSVGLSCQSMDLLLQQLLLILLLLLFSAAAADISAAERRDIAMEHVAGAAPAVAGAIASVSL